MEGEEFLHEGFGADGGAFACAAIPEAHALGALGHFALDEGEEADAVERGVAGGVELEHVEEGGEDVDGVAGHGDGGWVAGNACGPFEHGGHAESAFVDLAFVAATAGAAEGGEAAVVAAVPEDGVFVDAHGAEFGAEFAEGFVHAGEFAEEVGHGFGFLVVGVGGFVFVAGDVGVMGRSKPDDTEEGFVFFDLFAHEIEGGIDGDHGAFAFHFFGDSVATHGGVVVVEIGGGEPGVEAVGAGTDGAVFVGGA